MIPFFVADRPMSLRLLKGLPLRDYPGLRIGIMTHANTTENFQLAFRNYPCDNWEYCDAVGGPCHHRNDVSRCLTRQYILRHTVKMCDSGIFTREGATLSYRQLFEAYDRMGVEYGIMIDVFQDSQATLESAEEALQAYESFRDRFRLIGVAHGGSSEEYFDCYAQLQRLGFDYIAVGGLLQRRQNTVRFPYVRDEKFMFQVLSKLRQQYPADWLFALGCFHPSRLPTFKELNVWADYKGWIFQYEKRNETLDTHLEMLALNHLEHLQSQAVADQVSILHGTIARRSGLVTRQKNLSERLIDGRRTLRVALSSLHQELQKTMPEMAARFRNLTTHGLLKDAEERLVDESLPILGKQGSDEATRILENIRQNRELKEQLNDTEAEIEQVNALLVNGIVGLTDAGIQLPEATKRLSVTITDLIERTEREHRFKQVHQKISEEILALL
jgi:DNA-binding Lrp family transcriptional regulator